MPPSPASPRNLLLVTYSFPPFGGVGVHRALSLARYLPELGWNVHVLTAKNPSAVGKDLNLLKQVPESVTVHRCWTPDIPFGLKKDIKKLVGNPATQSAKSDMPSGRKSLASRLVQAVKDRLSPDQQILWLPFARRRAAAIVSKYAIDAVLITVPPFSSLQLASFLRQRFPKLLIVSDIRDEWLTYYFPTLGYNRSEAAWREAVRIERECVNSCDRVVTVTDKAKEEMAARYPDHPADKFRVIRNGYEPEIFQAFSSRRNTSSKVLLGYTGTVYAPADPTTFAQALDLLDIPLRNRIQIRFIGHVESAEHRALLEAHSPAVQLDGFLPQADAMKALEEMDFLLLIWVDTINIPGKLYDYLGTGKPILALAHPEGEVWKLMGETRAGWCADIRNPKAISCLFRDAFENRDRYVSEYSPDREAVLKCQRARRAEEYSEILQMAMASQAGRRAQAAT